ncbi:unnamed protein product [Schistocephalus solidus]|uniref:Metallophos domain-containing protein n=1 Tax=Schistocephalus solidus TaxID=70667 RepID=A0A183T178_SCHSO|nr:unnamed protein product [Schistocephalus solidus]
MCFIPTPIIPLSSSLGSFWHVTDPHIDPNYSCQGSLGNYECDSPLSLWISALNNTRQLRQQPPDFVIFSGFVFLLLALFALSNPCTSTLNISVICHNIITCIIIIILTLLYLLLHHLPIIIIIMIIIVITTTTAGAATTNITTTSTNTATTTTTTITTKNNNINTTTTITITTIIIIIIIIIIINLITATAAASIALSSHYHPRHPYLKEKSRLHENRNSCSANGLALHPGEIKIEVLGLEMRASAFCVDWHQPIVGRDSVAHTESLSRAKFLDVMRSAAKRLRALFPDNQIPIIPVLGNHDTHPSNVLEVNEPAAQKRHEWCGLLATDRDLWADWIALGQPDPAPNATRNSSEVFTSGNLNHCVLFRPYFTGCFFSRRLNISGGSSLVLISVNGMLWYSNNRKADASLPDPVGQFAWLEATLSRARESNTKVLLICHFPPGATENSPEKYRHFFEKYNQRFLDLLLDNADILIGGLFAHQHTDTFRVLKKDDRPALPLLFGPSISPWRLGGLGAFNPRIRVFQYVRRSLHLTDYQQLFLNLSAAEPTWAEEYSFRQEYRLPDTSAGSLSALLTDFVHSEGNWTRYWFHQLGGLPHGSGDCPQLGSLHRCQHLCAMFYLSYTYLDRCLIGCSAGSPLNKLLPSAFSEDGGLASTFGVVSDSVTEHWSPLPITVVVIVVFLAILLGVVMLVNRELCRRRRREHAGHLGNLFNANQNGYFGCSSASEAGGRDIDRFTSLSLSQPSSLDGSLEVQADEGALIRPGGDTDRHTTPLGRFSGLVKFNRTRGSCDHNYHPDEPINTPRSKFAAFTEPPRPRLAYISGDNTFHSPGAARQGGLGSALRVPPSDITDELGEEDEGVEEGEYAEEEDDDDNLEAVLDYDAEGEEEEDFFFRPPPLPSVSAPAATSGGRVPMNLKPLRDLLPSRLNGRCLLMTSTSIAPSRKAQSATSPPLPPTQDEVHDLSDAEYYSLHSSLQHLHSGRGCTRGSASPDSEIAVTMPTSQSASGAFPYVAMVGATDIVGDSCSTVDGETPSSGSLGGSLDSSSTSAVSKPQLAPLGLLSANVQSEPARLTTGSSPTILPASPSIIAVAGIVTSGSAAEA